MQFVNSFGECGGIDALLNILKICGSTEGENKIVPFKLLRSLSFTIITLYNYLEEALADRLMKAFKEALTKKFYNLTEKEIKDVDKNFLYTFVNDVRIVLEKHFKEEEVCEFIEKVKLELSLRFLTSPFLEKRLKGINEIKEISERIEYREYM